MSLSEQELKELCRLIYQESGLVYDHRQYDMLTTRLDRRLGQLAGVTPSEYVRDLNLSRGAELRHFLDLVTVNETYFYREIPQLQNFAEHVLRPLIAEKASRGLGRLRIWSAGSSIGCEAYTLAMLITEELDKSGAMIDWQVIGSDISDSVLQVAKEGLYTDRELKDVPESLKPKYFARDGNYWRYIHPSRQHVSFRYANLVHIAGAVEGPFDVIFCRNVFIYFDDAVRRRVADEFYDRLVQGGYVFLGSSESMNRISRAFELKRVGNGLVYVKE